MRPVAAILLVPLLFACSSRDDARAGTDGGMDSGMARFDAAGTDARLTDSANGGTDTGLAADGGGAPDGGATDAATALDGGSAADSGSDRTIVTEMCARRFGSCSNDSECVPSGCGGETCAPEEVLSTCDCVAPKATCGCVAGACAWYR